MADRAGRADSALATELLGQASAGAAAGELAERIVQAPSAEALAALAVLGRSRAGAAGPILAAVAEGNAPRQLRKEARRGLHQLRAQGLDVPRPSLPPAPPGPPAERLAELTEASATAADGVGSRALSLMATRPLGGVYAATLVLNDVVGIKACTVRETTRKRYQENLANWQADQPNLVWVRLPADYARQLIGEALELNRESGFTIPQDYQLYQQAIRDLARPFERALVYAELPLAEVKLNPEWLEASPELLDEQELKGWFFGFDEVRRYALDLVQARNSQIVLTEQLQARREEGIIANAIRDLLTPPLQRALRRRLEEVAYIFLHTGRQRQARRALAAADRLNEGALTLHPLPRAMMEKSLDLAAEVEQAKVPVALVRRSPYDPIV